MSIRYQETQQVIVTVPILHGARSAAGMGRDRIEALEHLVLWLAGAATEIDPDFEVPVEPDL